MAEPGAQTALEPVLVWHCSNSANLISEPDLEDTLSKLHSELVSVLGSVPLTLLVSGIQLPEKRKDTSRPGQSYGSPVAD